MAASHTSYGVVSQVAQRIYDEQSTAKEKSNTITSLVGLAATLIITLITYLIDHDSSWLPAWVPATLPFLGFLATTFGVSKTKNGMTKSVLEEINDAVNSMVDQLPEGTTRIEVGSSNGHVHTAAATAEPYSNIAEQLDAQAKQFAGKN